MDEQQTKQIFRISISEDAKVFLSLDGAEREVEVQRPVTEKTLQEARTLLIKEVWAERRKAEEQDDGDGDNDARVAVEEARKEIEKTLNPWRHGSWWDKVGISLASLFIFNSVFAIFMIAIGFAYRGLQLSSEHLPQALHLIVVLIYMVVLVFGISLIATEKRRWDRIDKIREWFGPWGIIALPCLILIIAAAVFAFFTLILYENNVVALTSPSGEPITEGSLLNFYMWHFLELIPILKINDILQWSEPLQYSQARVGFLILLFQGLVVIPSIATVRFYWKHRHNVAGEPYEHVLEQALKPKASAREPEKAA